MPHRDLQPEPHAPALARAFIRSSVSASDDVVERAELAASELVTNALRHARNPAGRPIRLVVQVGERRVRIEVIDPGHGFDFSEPISEAFGNDESTEGRGLLIVDAITDRYGVHVDGYTKVWFELDLEAP